MPEYTIRDPQSGVTLTVRGDSPPTEAELSDLFAHTAGQAASPAQAAQATPAAPSTPGAPGRTWGDTASDLAGGVRAGVANTVFGGGDLIRRAAGMPRIVNEPDVKAMMTPPESGPGKAGYYGEQIGEFFLPTGLVGKAGKAAEVLKSGVLTLAQGGTPTEAGVSAGLTAVIPGGSATKRASAALSEGAEKSIAQGLGATKEWAKAESRKLAPEMLERGVSGTRKGMLEEARAAVAEVGPRLDKAYRDAAAAGATVSGDIIRGNLQLASEKFMIRLGPGKRVPIAGTEAIVTRLKQIEDFVEKLGPDVPVDKAAVIKKTWDQIVSKAGLYGQKATASATDNASAWAVREAAGSFRELLNANPTIEALNKEFGFWKGLKNVLTETEKRTQAQSNGLTQTILMSAGASGGFASGSDWTDRFTRAAEGAAFGKVVHLMQSPYWRTAVAAPLKNTLADLMASGTVGQVESFSKVIVRSIPAQLRPALEE